jgi:hypothetical protein
MLTHGILLLSIAAATAAAKPAPRDTVTPSWAPAPGSHIRGYLLRPDTTRIDGWVVRYYDMTAAISTCAYCDVTLYVPIDSVLALEEEHDAARHRGSSFAAHVAKSMAIGAGVGTGIGALLLGTDHCTGDMCGLDVLIVPIGTVIGGGAGLIAGLVSGVAASERVWTPVQRL